MLDDWHSDVWYMGKFLILIIGTNVVLWFEGYKLPGTMDTCYALVLVVVRGRGYIVSMGRGGECGVR